MRKYRYSFATEAEAFAFYEKHRDDDSISIKPPQKIVQNRGRDGEVVYFMVYVKDYGAENED